MLIKIITLFGRLITLGLFFTFTSIFCQEYSGLVVDKNNQPIPYCAIFNKTIGFGTYSDSSGMFSMEAKPGDSLIFKHVAFNSRVISLMETSFRSNRTVLTPKSINLPQLTIATSKSPNNWLPSNNYRSRTWIAPERPGNSFVALVKPSHKQNQRIHGVRFKRKIKHCDNLVFRLLAYKNQNGAPGEELLKQSVELDVSKTRDKTLNFDLSAQNLLLPPEGVFIGLEYMSKDGYFFKACPLSIAISPNPTEGFIRSNLRYPPELWSPALYTNESSFVLNMELGF